MRILYRPNYSESEKERFEYFQKEIESVTKNTKKYKLLDIGCSQFEFVFKGKRVDSYGIDYIESKQYEKKFFKKCNLNTNKIPFTDSFFDFVIAGEVIEHVKKPFELIEEISRVLKNGGTAYISTPTPHYILEIIKELLDLNNLDDKEHLNLFSRMHLISYCKKNNLMIKEIKYYKFWIPFLGIMLLHVGMPKFFGYQIIYKLIKK